MPRRRAGELLPIELEILSMAARLRRERVLEFHGFQLASELASGERARSLLGHGTLYKALDRLERGGLLESTWEDIDESLAGRPRRRLYRLTGAGVAAVPDAAQRAARQPVERPRWAAT